MSLRTMNIAPRAFLGFSLIGALMLILGIFALSQMSKIRAAGDEVAQNSVPSIQSLDALTVTGIRMRVLSYRLLTNREPDVQDKTIELFALRNKQINDAQAIYEKLISSPEEQSAYNEFVRLLADYRQIEGRLVSLSRAGNLVEMARLLNTESVVNSDQMNVVLAKLADINSRELGVTNKMAANEYRAAFNWVVGLLIVATILTMLFAWLLTNSITRPIAAALEAAETIAEGNLTRPIKVDGTDEAGRLLAAMQKMQEKLRDTLMRISGSATQLASAAEELNAVTDESARPVATEQRNRAGSDSGQRNDQRRGRSGAQRREHVRGREKRHRVGR